MAEVRCSLTAIYPAVYLFPCRLLSFPCQPLPFPVEFCLFLYRFLPFPCKLLQFPVDFCLLPVILMPFSCHIFPFFSANVIILFWYYAIFCMVVKKQNKTKQNKAKQNKTKQNKTKQNKTKQNKRKQNKNKNKNKHREMTKKQLYIFLSLRLYSSPCRGVVIRERHKVNIIACGHEKDFYV